jgi:hypothetical protein
MEDFMRIAGFMLMLTGVLGLLPEQAHAAEELMQQASYQITAPDQARIGSKVQIGWAGKQVSGNYITIVPPDAAEGEYRQFIYTADGTTLGLSMPLETGVYEIRLNSESQGTILARKSIDVVASHIEMSFPQQVPAGSEVEVEFSGTVDGDDWITIVPIGAAPGAFKGYRYCKEGSPLSLQVPETAGAYEVRYVSGFQNHTLLAEPITVVATTATLRAEPSGYVGHRLPVHWQGPAGSGDYLSIAPVGAPDENYVSYRLLAQAADPLELELPAEPGAYEIRYQTGREHLVLARQPVEVVTVASQLKVAGPVTAGENFRVDWQGPDGEGDYISILRDDESKWLYWSYTKWGNPVELMAPDTPGRYRLCYQNRNNRILAETALDVTPGNKPGSLSIVGQTTDISSHDGTAVEVVLDASGSMLKREGGKTRMALALSALEQMVQKELSAKTEFALRVFGHRQAGSCQSDLEIPLSALNKQVVSQKMAGIHAQNLAKTPIAASLDHVAQDLAGHKGPAIVVLLTDGEETCGGDPRASIQRLIDAGTDVRINVVGFSIGDSGLKRLFEAWAQVGNGVFLDASTPEQLTQRMAQSIQTPFHVVDGAGKVVAQGTMDKKPILLKAGSYRLEWGSGWRQHRDIEIQSGQTTRVKI